MVAVTAAMESAPPEADRLAVDSEAVAGAGVAGTAADAGGYASFDGQVAAGGPWRMAIRGLVVERRLVSQRQDRWLE